MSKPFHGKAAEGPPRHDQDHASRPAAADLGPQVEATITRLERRSRKLKQEAAQADQKIADIRPQLAKLSGGAAHTAKTLRPATRPRAVIFIFVKSRDPAIPTTSLPRPRI
jgi:hypothetical protein